MRWQYRALHYSASRGKNCCVVSRFGEKVAAVYHGTRRPTNVQNFLPARRYARAGLRESNVSVRPSVRLSVRLSHAGIESKRRKLAS